MFLGFSGYGFAQHKGYGTRQHQLALQQLGVTPIHRRSYAPVRALCCVVKKPEWAEAHIQAVD